ncbi:MAG TPA: DUF6285 domain-containing protein [Acidimicrobiia bacterium]|nr:DUF6285 domain-containing protein [Acidimicrobiia bacterium]
MAQDRPTADELLEAVAEFLARDVVPGTDGRLSFHARVAANVVGIVRRELASGSALDDEEHARLRALLGHDGTRDELDAELARRIRDGSLDDQRDAVVDHVRRTVRAKLTIANPRYLET